MNDGGVRRSGRSRKPPTSLHDVYVNECSDAHEAGGSQPVAEVGNPGRSDNTITGKRQLKRPRAERRQFEVSQQEESQTIAQEPEQAPQSAQHANHSDEAPETQLVVSTAVQENTGEMHEVAAATKVKKMRTKRKKTKYDPAPMKAVAERAQDILEPVSQTLVPTAVNPCAALNCRPSAALRCGASLPPLKVLTGTCIRSRGHTEQQGA